MGKKLLIIPIVLLIVVAFVYLTMLSPPLVTAELVINSGTVQVKSGADWVPVKSGMQLKQGDVIKTGTSSSAEIIFFESSVLRMDENTEIELKELVPTKDGTKVVVREETGKIWNRIVRLSGIDVYTVETPVAIAKVRGTAFSVHASDTSTDVLLVQGSLDLSAYQIEDANRVVYASADLEAGQMATIIADQTEIEIKDIVEDGFLQENMDKDGIFLEEVRDEFVARFSTFMPLLKDQINVSDEEVEEFVLDYLKGDADIPAEAPQIVRDILEGEADMSSVTNQITQLASGVV